MGKITKIKIFPSIGIMRVGNSPDEYYISPEAPGQYELPAGGFKDAQCRIKRQAARFRLYGYDVEGSPPIEITAKDAQITWTVRLANKKASGKRIYPHSPDEVEGQLRNDWYMGDREDLNIKPSPRSLTGKNQGPVKFDDGKFLKKENGAYVKSETVILGEMRTDEIGRLLVLGGFGKSGGVVPEGVEGYPKFIRTYNTPGWYDDIADGPITARVILNGELFTEQDILPAWVICGPPAYVPQLSNLTTLYDALRQTALNQAKAGNLPGELVKGLEAPAQPSFAQDVLPILQRILDLYWVSDLVKITKPDGSKSSYQEVPHYPYFKDAATANQTRSIIFASLKPPGNPKQGTMPKLWGDDYFSVPPETVLTPTQYSTMQNWAEQGWVDPPPTPAPPPFQNPEDLTRAALEACVGGALKPGIEAGRFLRDTCRYREPFRPDHDFIKEDGAKLEAGDMTRDMALPWQGDFANCRQEGYAWWPAARPDQVFPDINSANSAKSEVWVRDIINEVDNLQREDMVEKWHKLGFVVREGDKFVETERDLVCNDLFLILDRTHFSSNEVPNTFKTCFYVVLEGFSPVQLGIMKEPLTKDDLISVAPDILLTLADTGVSTKEMTAAPQEILFEVSPFDKDKAQRLTFVYQIEFKSAADFNSIGTQTITLTARKKPPMMAHTFSAVAQLTLFKQPNPYMQDGPVSWLSEDVRVFKVLTGENPFGILFPTLKSDTAQAGAEAANAFIKQVVNEFNKNQTQLQGHPFEQLQTDQGASALELAEKSDGKRAFNFAVARVRYRGSVPAQNVRVFFRLFTTAATGLDYHEATTYRRREDGDPIALLGLQAGNIVSISCYGDSRADSETKQTDVLNVNTLGVSDKGETYCYFGCWLDFNQTTPRLPDPFNPAQKKSIQDQIRGLHQCLVAEIYYQEDSITEGATPASSDNLAQRNLMISEAPNPGIPESRIVHHTFEIKADANQPTRPDELMIRWNDLPRTSRVALYLPGVETEVMRLAAQNYEAGRLERVEAHTIRCLPGDVTYVPLPTARTENIPALLTIELPEGITRGNAFNIVVHQVSGQPRRLLGAFQMNIPVSVKAALLKPEIHSLSVLRYIFRSIPVGDRWHPVFARYLDQVAGRVSGFGGNPETVAASPDGSEVNQAATRCARVGWLVSLALALLIIVAGLHPLASYLPEAVAAILLFGALLWWLIKCVSSVCRFIVAGLVGMGTGAAVLATFMLVGLAQQHGPIVLVVAALISGALAVTGVLTGCLSFIDKPET